MREKTKMEETASWSDPKEQGLPALLAPEEKRPPPASPNAPSPLQEWWSEE